jgi:NAD(P)-dependent dehydrogenase (short-subunit alcohol dehydrogenase family)
VSLLGLDERPHEDRSEIMAGFAATVLLVQAAERLGLAAPVWSVTSDAVAMPGDRVAGVRQAQLWGFGRIVALELPHRWGGLVDVTPAGRERFAGSLAWLLSRRSPDEHASGEPWWLEDQVAVRADGLYARRIARAGLDAGAEPSTAADASTGTNSPETSSSPRWRAHDTVLITGGTAGIGAEVARLAARAGARRVVLLSRSGPAAAGAERLRTELGSRGCEVLIETADVSSRDDVRRVVAATGPEQISAVIHSAGTDVAAPVGDLTFDHLARSMSAKVLGALHLEEALAEAPLQRVVVFSSIAGVWGGGGGMGAYAAANAFLDAFAARRRDRGQPGTSVAWGPWGETGMATRQDGLIPQLAVSGLRALGTADAMATLDSVLAGRDRGVALADINWERFGLTFTFGRPSPLLSDLCEDAW